MFETMFAIHQPSQQLQNLLILFLMWTGGCTNPSMQVTEQGLQGGAEPGGEIDQWQTSYTRVTPVLLCNYTLGGFKCFSLL